MNVSRRNLPRIAFAAFLVLSAVGVGLMTGYTLIRLRDEAMTGHLDRAAQYSRAFENLLTQSLNMVDLTLRHLPEVVDLGQEPEQIGERLMAAVRHAPYLRSLSLTDLKGRVYASSSPGNLGVTVAMDDYLPHTDAPAELLRFGAPWEGRDFGNGRPTTADQPAAPQARLFLPLSRRLGGETTPASPAIALASLNPDYFLNQFSQHIPPEEGAVEVLRYDHVVLFSTDIQDLPGRLHEQSLGQVDFAANEFGRLDHHYEEGLPTLTAYRTSRHFPFVVVVHLDRQKALAKWRQEARSLGSTVALSLLAALLLASVFFLRLQRAARLQAEADKRLRLAAKVFDASVEGIMITDGDNRIVSVNPAFVRITGRSEMEALGQNPRILSSGLHDAAFYQTMWRDIVHRNGWSGEVINRRPDGTTYTEHLSISRLLDDQGKPAHYVGVFSDISEKKRADDLLRKLSLAVDQSPSSVVITALDGAIEYVNQAFERNTGYTAAEALGHNPRLLQSGQTSAEEYGALWEALTQGRSWEGEFVNRRKDGGLFVEHALISPVISADGQVTHYLAIKHDVTENRRLTEQLRQAKEAAEAANQAKSSFLANMSHELRTPLNAVMGHAQILARDASLGEEQRRAVHVINRSGEHLLNLINDILDLARIEAGRLDLAPAPCHTEALFNTLSEMAAIRAQQKGIAFRSEVVTPLPAVVETDPKRVRQIALNLLSNAVKFTDRGEVVLRTGYSDGAFMLEVEDTGPGIPADQQERIFDRFHQVGDSRYKFQGTGLGLAITRELVTRMGGAITLRSAPGVGSCFRVTIPARVVSNATLPPEETETPEITGYHRRSGQGPLRVLIVDDLEDNRAVLRHLLEHIGFETQEAAGGQEALALAVEQPPDLILMDLRMPGMDGFEATRRLRRLPMCEGAPILAISAAAYPQDREEAIQAGCNDHLPKPVRLATLIRLLPRLLPMDWEFADAKPPPPAKPQPPLSETQRTELLRLVTRGDIQAVREYLEQLAAAPDTPAGVPDLLILAKEFRMRQLRDRLHG